jgi:hypothetical protein
MTSDQIRARIGLDAMSELETALVALRQLTAGLPGADAALDRAWRAYGAAENALRHLSDETADEPPAPGM